MKTLFVIAGPNGAGKSTFGKELVRIIDKQTVYFDGDKSTSKLKLKYPEYLEGDIQDMLEIEFLNLRDYAIFNGKSFAYETNFSDSWLARDLADMKKFKSKDYKVILLFYDTIDLETSLNRVKLRVLSGGHNVSINTIKYNFHNSFKNFIKAYSQFDESFLFLNSWANNLNIPYCIFQYRSGFCCIDFEYIKNNKLIKYEPLAIE